MKLFDSERAARKRIKERDIAEHRARQYHAIMVGNSHDAESPEEAEYLALKDSFEHYPHRDEPGFWAQLEKHQAWQRAREKALALIPRLPGSSAANTRMNREFKAFLDSTGPAFLAGDRYPEFPFRAPLPGEQA